MVIRFPVRLYPALAAVLLFVASPAAAQFTPRTLNDPATGEQFHIEGFAGFWMPSADMSVAIEQFGIPGSEIDFKNDLGLTDQRLGNLQLVLRPLRQHKLRFQLTPMEYDQESTIKRDIVFNGQLYAKGLPTISQFQWREYRFAYEYDFITRNRGFGGLILDAEYYHPLGISLQSPAVNELYRFKQLAFPAIGGIARFYVVPNISVTGEFTAMKIPESLGSQFGVTDTHFADIDIYGTLNFTNNIGVQGGFRSLNLTVHHKEAAAVLQQRGIYFGVVARY